MIHKGYFLLTDISGYTMFLTSSELDHADGILQQLFNTLLSHIQPPLVLSNLQGDAILAYIPEDADLQPQTVIETIERLYFDFRRQIELMTVNTSCPCNACINISLLDLKVFVHYGSYLVQELGEKKELVGSDVILAHRMMKNTVKEKTGLNGYALITDKALEPLAGTTLLTPLVAHEEEYEHIGTVGMQVYPLSKKWEEEREKRRIRLDQSKAWVAASCDLPVPPEAAWDLFVDPESMGQWLSTIAFDRTDERGGRIQTGATMHCVHDIGTVDFVYVDWNPQEFYMTCQSDNHIANLKYRYEGKLERTATGSRFTGFMETPFGGENVGAIDELQPMFKEMNDQIAADFQRLLNEKIAEGKIVLGNHVKAEESASS